MNAPISRRSHPTERRVPNSTQSQRSFQELGVHFDLPLQTRTRLGVGRSKHPAGKNSLLGGEAEEGTVETIRVERHTLDYRDPGTVVRRRQKWCHYLASRRCREVNTERGLPEYLVPDRGAGWSIFLTPRH